MPHTISRRRTRKSVTERVLALAFALAALVVLGEAGHVVLDDLSAVVAHHFFHLVFPVVASIIFAVLAGRDVRAHGWPRLSLSLRPSSSLPVAGSARTGERAAHLH